jgi:hypothetical protein
VIKAPQVGIPDRQIAQNVKSDPRSPNSESLLNTVTGNARGLSSTGGIAYHAQFWLSTLKWRTAQLFILPQEILYSQGLSPRAKFTLQALASHCGQTDQAWPSMDRLAKFMSQSIRTAQRGMAELLEKGLVERTLRHITTPLYRVACMVQRGPCRAERRRQGKEPASNLSTDRGDNHDTRPLGSSIPFLEQSNNNDHYSTVYVPPTVQTDSQQGYPNQNNGFQDTGMEKPKRMHPAEARLLAEDIAEALGYQSFKYWLKIAWRASEQAIYEALSFVKGEMLEGHAENPCGLFVYRLRQFHGLRI